MRYHCLAMSDEQRPTRRPLGERDEEERRQPFGSRPPGQHEPFSSGLPPNAPYRRSHEPAPAPPVEPTPPAEAEELIEEEEPEDEVVEAPPAEDDLPYPDAALAAETPADEAAAVPEVRVGQGTGLAGRRRVRRRRLPPPEPLETVSYMHPPEAEVESRPQVVIRFGVLLRSIMGIFVTAAVIATLFTWWTPNTFLPRESMDRLAVALATQSSQSVAPTIGPPTPTPAPVLTNVGIVSGHRGLYPSTGQPDPGAICADGLTEQEVNEAVALQVVELLRGHGYDVDLLDEFDERLNGYKALALVSIHADSCEYINELATGFKVASFSESATPEEDARLVECLAGEYAVTTGLSFHPSVTFDMTRYHTFREIAPGTPGAIIEMGFLYLDRQLLTENADVVALGIARGILCYLRGEYRLPIEATPVTVSPTLTPPENNITETPQP